MPIERLKGEGRFIEGGLKRYRERNKDKAEEIKDKLEPASERFKEAQDIGFENGQNSVVRGNGPEQSLDSD